MIARGGTAPEGAGAGRVTPGGRREGVRRYLPYLRAELRVLIVMLASAVIAIAAATAIPQLFKSVIDGPVAHGRVGELPLYAALIVALALVEAGAQYVRRDLAGLVSFRMETAIRNHFYAHLQRLDVGFHDNWQSGQLLSRAIGDINTIRRFMGFGFLFAVVFLVQSAAVLAMLFRLDWTLALVTLAGVAPVALLSRHFIRRYGVLARRMQDQQGDVTTVIEEMATGVRIIKSFGRDDLLLDRYRREISELRRASLDTVNSRAWFSTLMTLIPNANLVLVVLLGGFAVLQAHLTVGGLVAYVTYLYMLIWPMDALGWILAMGEEANTASDRLSEVFDTVPAIADREGAITLAECRGEVRLEGVRFGYAEGGEEVLRGVDLHVRPGETMALVGRTGSGKTTLVNLVARLYDVDGGAVRLDGHDVRDLTVASLRGHIGTAFEDPILFSASVHENLVMGRDIHDDAELRRAIEVAQAGFVWDLPWGLETRVGEQGHSLSGGQRQRLALARAVLGRPRVLVLDDPLSSVDVHTEAVIEAALRRVLDGVTALLVAHRPSTLSLADRVALLDGGRVVAVGTHAELMHGNRLYADLLSQAPEPHALEAGGSSSR